ncbi:MAG: DoxX family protein [Phycisphaeraceae bacterium]
MRGALTLLGRILFTAIFVFGAYGAITGWQQHVGAIEGTDLPAAIVMAIGSVALLVLGALSLILGLFTRWGAVLLMIFLAVVTPLMHPFWDDPTQQPAFFKNVSLFGALLLILAFGPGPWSLDRWRERRRARIAAATRPESAQRPL